VTEVSAEDICVAAANGGVLDCHRDGGRGRVSASVLRRLCAQSPEGVDARGIQLRGAEIVGALDLRGLVIAHPVHLEDCFMAEAPLLNGAQLPALSVLDCHLPGIIANGLKVAGDLDLSGSTISGVHKTSASTSKRAAVWLCESLIGGRLLCVNTKIYAPGERAIQADGMQVSGTVRLLHDFEAHGEIRLLGVRIDGSLDLTGAHLSDPLDGLALDLGHASIGGSVFLIPSQNGRRPEIRGRIDMGSAHVSGQLVIRAATLEAVADKVTGGGYSTLRRGGSALNGPQLFVGGDVTFEDDCDVVGGIDLSLSEVGTVWLHGECRLTAPGGVALDMTNAELRSSLTCMPGLIAKGTLQLSGTHVHGHLSLRGTTWSKPESQSLIAA